MPDYANPWDAILAHIRARMDEENYRRWFAATSYASDSGDQITVWAPTEPMRRHISIHLQHHVSDALKAIGRPHADVRYVVTGVGEEEENEY